MCAIHPLMGKQYYFIDKCMPFGSSISCAQFQAFSNALKHIIEWKVSFTLQYDIPPAVLNYLDDFLFMAISKLLCDGMMTEFLELCSQIGCPISGDKTEWGTTLIVSLGILLNGRNHTLSIPVDKRIKAINLIQFAMDNRKVTIHFRQKLTRTLNFLNRAFVPGRAFTKGMYKRLTWRDSKGNPLKKFHHVYLNREFIQDCKVWLKFLIEAENTRLCRPFLDLGGDHLGAQILNFMSDASKNLELGMGAVFNARWLMQPWPISFIKKENPSIEYLELYALTAAMLKWRKDFQLRDACVVVFCDNESVLYMVNKLGSNCTQCMKLIRILALESIIWNRKLIVKYIRSEHNILSDSLSRLNLKKFWKHAPENMNPDTDDMTDLPIWPMCKIWVQQNNYLPSICF